MENYPTVVLEAMAHGKPVIGSERGGIGEMIDHDRSGLLYPARDSQRLAQHIERLANSESEAREMGRAGRQWLRENSNQELFGRKICGLFRDLVDSDYEKPPQQPAPRPGSH